MNEPNDDLLICEGCENSIKTDDEFCPECGDIFIDEVFCENHNAVLANGVCIICALPYCETCGVKTNNHFLCNEHSDYEIYSGMARVFGTLDDTAAQFAKTCLEQAGIHSLLFCRHQPKGGPRFAYTLFEAQGDYLGHLVNEIKVMVPCQEVVKAEEILKSIKIED